MFVLQLIFSVTTQLYIFQNCVFGSKSEIKKRQNHLTSTREVELHNISEMFLSFVGISLDMKLNIFK